MELITDTLLRSIFEAVLPLLATAITSWVIILARKAWAELQEHKPDVVRLIIEASQFVVPVVEQLKRNGTIPDNEAAKAYAINAVQDYLEAKGITIDIERYITLIDDAIEGTVRGYQWGRGQ